MYCIIPLAGPDFILPDGTLKPFYPYKNEPLIISALCSRPWINSLEVTAEKMIFVLRETGLTQEFKLFLEARFTGCRIVTVSTVTRGALLSAVAGSALIDCFTEPVCVDLVDILYTTDYNVQDAFAANPDLAGIVPYFVSDNPKFSYLDLSHDGVVTRTVEKQVISNKASAGTYFFKDLATFVSAVSGSVRMDNLLSYNSSLFLCPAYNPLIQENGLVKSFEVSNVISLSEIFHSF